MRFIAFALMWILVGWRLNHQADKLAMEVDNKWQDASTSNGCGLSDTQFPLWAGALSINMD